MYATIVLASLFLSSVTGVDRSNAEFSLGPFGSANSLGAISPAADDDGNDLGHGSHQDYPVAPEPGIITGVCEDIMGDAQYADLPIVKSIRSRLYHSLAAPVHKMEVYANRLHARVSPIKELTEVNRRARRIMEAYVQHRSDPSIILLKHSVDLRKCIYVVLTRNMQTQRIELNPTTKDSFSWKLTKATSNIAGSMLKFRYESLNDHTMYELLKTCNPGLDPWQHPI
ncbi:hypothetical protein BJ085DRAFT_38249 [Dimargaris cristalligena]|uniref:Uncharacterized protein n=1 Tax=Dimargaris cristalligena TaxID=215637 RepID=A0A4P9ZVB1_9FUNG|nr:hypothetical protein BJ085DRAFT_38249 [Dimargaris cristalligena]|eukprot:RKP37515.1 hypothetical protein BJ085DRAFT_38249 [Dimargaris cristalligena]